MTAVRVGERVRVRCACVRGEEGCTPGPSQIHGGIGFAWSRCECVCVCMCVCACVRREE